MKSKVENKIKNTKKSWKEIPGGTLILEPGSSLNYKTGDWRTFRPVTDFKKCTHCMICWVDCPDGCIIVKNGKKLGTNYNYCKGCGVCAEECPVKCIQMKPESEFRK